MGNANSASIQDAVSSPPPTNPFRTAPGMEADAFSNRNNDEDALGKHGVIIEDPTRACVIGAGFSGVHCALELAKIGFHVTVIDENSDVAQGGTKYAHGTFGATIPFRPGVWNTSILGEIFFSALPSAARTFLGNEMAPWDLMGFKNWRFAYTRYRMQQNTPTQMRQWTTFLADENESVMAQLIEEHPQLKRCVIAQQEVTVESASGADQESSVEGASTTAPTTAKELINVIDPVMWTRTMRDICATKYGIKFMFGRPVLRIPFRMAGGTEFAPNIIVKAPNDEDDTPMNYVMGYDLVVIAAGAGSADLTWNSYPLPMLTMSGYGVDFKESNPLFKAALDKTRESTKNILHLGDSGFLRLSPIRAAEDEAKAAAAALAQQQDSSTPATNANAPTPKAAPSVPDWRLSGLLSMAHTFDNYKPTLEHCLNVLRPRLRLQADVDIPEYTAPPPPPAPKEGEPAIPEAVIPEESLARPFSFDRGFTADGMPIISRLGNARNVFVCTGFGDDTVMFGAGAARILGKLLTHKLDEDGNPFAMKRFKSFKEFDQRPYWSWAITLYATEDAVGMWGVNVGRAFVTEVSSYPLVRYWLNLDVEKE